LFASRGAPGRHRQQEALSRRESNLQMARGLTSADIGNKLESPTVSKSIRQHPEQTGRAQPHEAM
jgi:hypothetical protein